MKKKGEKSEKQFFEIIFWIIIFQAPKNSLQKKNSIFTNHQIEVEGGGAKYLLLGLFQTVP